MDRPNTELAAAVEVALAMPHRADGVKHLLELRVPDATIARVLCERTDRNKRRRPSNQATADNTNVAGWRKVCTEPICGENCHWPACEVRVPIPKDNPANYAPPIADGDDAASTA
jgi:hypothetical protein